MTELRLAGAVTIEEANALLKEFLDRFNARFGVPAQHPEAAYRPLGPRVCLDTALCFRHSRRVARDNTVKYRWRTLQLMHRDGAAQLCRGGGRCAVRPGRPSGCMRYRREIIPSQEAPPRGAGILRSFNDCFFTRDTPTSRLNGLSRRWDAALAALDAQMDAAMLTTRPSTTAPSVVRKAPAMQRRKPTPLQTARWRRCSACEAQGVVDSRGRPGTRHPSGHGKEVHGSSELADEARSGRIGAFCYHREQYK